MTEFDQQYPFEQGSGSGRRMGRSNFSTEVEIKRALAGLLAVVIFGITERTWQWIKEKRSKNKN